MDEIETIDMSTIEEHHPPHHIHPEETSREYTKFVGVIGGIFLSAVILTLIRGWTFTLFLNDFMAMFFIVFAGFKFMNIEAFVVTYRTYDVLAKHIRPWAYVFPFIEALLGFSYLLLTDDPQMLHVITIIITGTAAYGVFKALKRKSKFHCACLGTFIKLPLSTVSLVEDVSMFLMALLMFFL